MKAMVTVANLESLPDFGQAGAQQETAGRALWPDSLE